MPFLQHAVLVSVCKDVSAAALRQQNYHRVARRSLQGLCQLHSRWLTVLDNKLSAFLSAASKAQAAADCDLRVIGVVWGAVGP
jgi:hypothetical protein